MEAMQKEPLHLMLPASVMQILSALSGNSLDAVTMQNVVIAPGRFEMETLGGVKLWVAGFGNPLLLDCRETMLNKDTEVIELMATHEEEVHLASENVQLFFQNFIISKIEVWAEHIDGGDSGISAVVENTLFFSDGQGQCLLVIPDLAGPEFTIITDASAAETYLGSGRFYLKHILN